MLFSENSARNIPCNNGENTNGSINLFLGNPDCANRPNSCCYTVPFGFYGAVCCRGERGERGLKGEQGERGFRGEKGEKGERGFTGEKGEKGDKGERGFAGEKGDKGERGERGFTGEKGEKGDKGDKGDAGQCCCMSKGEMLTNGTMENFNGNKPIGWNVYGAGAFKQTQDKRVHAGDCALTMKDYTSITQEICGIEEGCYYQLSFFAHNEDKFHEGNVCAKVIFVTHNGNYVGGAINVKADSIPEGDQHYGYYCLTTTPAPHGACRAIVYIQSSDENCKTEARVDIDDISFKVA